MAVTSRESLKQYALRALGFPVIEINVDDEQLEDRLDEAVEYWRLYHPQGIEQIYMKHYVTASRLTITGTNAGSFQLLETVTGSSSGATAIITREGDVLSDESTALVWRVKGIFIASETITGSSSGATAVLGIVPFAIGTWDEKYINIPDLVYGVTRVLPMTQAYSSKNIFDVQYQLRLNDLYDVSSTSLINYTTTMAHLALLDFELNAKPNIRFNRYVGKLFLDVNWDTISIGQIIVIDCYRALDPTTAVKMWSDSWLKKYVEALFLLQFGRNLSKFSGIQTLGGVTLDGPGMVSDAAGTIKDLEDDLMSKSAPLSFFMG